MKRIVCIIGVIAIVFLLGIGLNVARELGISLVAESALGASGSFSASYSPSMSEIYTAACSAGVIK